MSIRRQKQAAATRQGILQAARRLFGERGYAATSMPAIASEAGAAVQTIYDSVGPKSAVLLAIIDLLDEEAGVPEIVAALHETDDPLVMIGLMVRLQWQFHQRCGDMVRVLIDGAAHEPAVAAALAEGHSRHRWSAAHIVGRINELGALRSGLSPEHAAATLDVMTWQTCAAYVEQHGWTYEQFDRWLTDDLCRLLLQDGV